MMIARSRVDRVISFPERVAGMSARFAGSERVGDRRRRRLAVEADDVADELVRTTALPASAGNVRTLDLAHTKNASRDAVATSISPVSRLIPFAWWKYLIAAVGLLAISGGLLIAGWQGAELTPVLGPGFERLFALPDSPAARWFSGILLFVAAELAFFVWWARSQSQNDFDGRYWLWIRVACVWLFFSGCVATGAHVALRETVLHFRPDFSDTILLLVWLAPAGVLGAAVVAGLVREMRACPGSRGLLLLAAARYLCGRVFSRTRNPALCQRGVCSSCRGTVGRAQCSFLSMWWHARHVVHCTADPAMRPKSSWRIPRPHFRFLHFRLPQFGRKIPLDAAPQEEVARPTSRRKRPVKIATVEPKQIAELDPPENQPVARPEREADSLKPQIQDRRPAREHDGKIRTRTRQSGDRSSRRSSVSGRNCRRQFRPWARGGPASNAGTDESCSSAIAAGEERPRSRG